jgi:uncharacterized membrane protein YfcA
MEPVMDGTLAILLSSLFLGAFVSGLAGFAMGVIVLSVWLHFLPPLQCALLVVAFGLITQGYGTWKLRHAFEWRRIAPFVVGGLLGVPVGTAILAASDPRHFRAAVGLLIIAYSCYALIRPAIRIERSNTAIDLAVGALNGALAGSAGIIGIVITLWCQLRGWTKDVQRTVFQPVMLCASVLSTVVLATAGGATWATAKLFALGVPVTFAGTWLGLHLYGKVSELAFRRVVLVLLLMSGASLVARALTSA